MSDTDDDVIAQLQQRRTRPRRKPPAHRPAQGTPSPPEIHTAAAKAGDASRPPAASAEATDIEDSQAALAPADDHSQKPRKPTGDRAPAATHTARRTPPKSSQATNDRAERLRLDPDEPSANYAVRVRRTLDDLVAWRLAELRRNGVRCSKVEITEMLLWEIADIDVAELAARLKVFRQHASR
jgi:hypothetical protein